MKPFSFDKMLSTSCNLIFKACLIIKVTIVLTAYCLSASADDDSRTVLLSAWNAPIEKVFFEIQKQTGYHFEYKPGILVQAELISIQLKNVSVKEALDICFRGQSLQYTIMGHSIKVYSIPDETGKAELYRNSNTPLILALVIILLLILVSMPEERLKLLLRAVKKSFRLTK